MKGVILSLAIAIIPLLSYGQHNIVANSKTSEYYLYEETVHSVSTYANSSTYEVWVHEGPVKGQVVPWRNKEIETRKELKMKLTGFAKYSYSKCLFQFDCSSKRFKILETIYYSADGVVLDSDKGSDMREWETCPPGSVVSDLTQSVCTYADLNNIR